MQACISVTSQLNIEVWQELLKDYWDQQLLQWLRFGFPLDFNRNGQLHCEGGNHSSATQYPKDVDAYIQEESMYGAILGPFKENPIKNSHTSPFMTRNKPNYDRRRVIIDLSWPLGASVNAGIGKDTYLGSPFALIFTHCGRHYWGVQTPREGDPSIQDRCQQGPWRLRPPWVTLA